MADSQDIVEQIKQKVLIEDVIADDGYPLPQRGRYRKCSREGTGGLVVDTQIQWYHWNIRGEFGDVISWVQREHSMDFKSAITWLARRAGLPEPNWNHESVEKRVAARLQGNTLEIAQRVFVRWFLQSQEAQAYAKRRGWTGLYEESPEDNKQDSQGDKRPEGAEKAEKGPVFGDTGGPGGQSVVSEGHGQNESQEAGQEVKERPLGTMFTAMLGYSGEGTPAEREEMRKELILEGIDLQSPAAVAILGMHGPDVLAWARDHHINLQDKWVTGGYIPGMIGRKRLIYPHIQNGQIVYLSGRTIEGKDHFNLAEQLVGKRRVYLNQAYAPAKDAVVIVEGQADAISLGQWGIPALALAGVAAGNDLTEMLKHHKTVYIGLDVDKAGKTNAWKIADILGPTTRLVSWVGPAYQKFADAEGNKKEVKDANDLLRAMVQANVKPEGQSDYVAKLLRAAPMYAEEIAEWAGGQKGAEKDQAVLQALKVLAKLDEMTMAQYRKSLADKLDVTVRELANMIKTTQATAEKTKTLGDPIYTFGGYIDGFVVEYLYDAAEERASLAWRDPNGVIVSGDSIEIGNRLYVAYPPNDVVKKGAVVFPSRLGESKPIRELVAYIALYLQSVYILPSDKVARLIAYYVLSTWVYDCFETVIYLRAMGGAGSGKSELMKRIGLVCYRTMTANGAGTTSSLFRTLERYKGTVYIDEADISYSDTENDMVKFYNLGAMRDNPIWRTIEMTGPDGEKVWEAVSFQTFCPKLVAMRKEFKDDAVGSRSLTIHLQPREMTELVAAGIPLSINQTIRGKAEALRNMLVRFRLETWQPDIEIDQSLYDLTISARLNQVAGPLLAMAKDDDAQREDIKTTLREYYRESILNMSMTITARVIEALWKIYLMPDLHTQFVRIEDEREMIRIGDVSNMANAIIQEMNNEEEEDDDGPKRNDRKLKPRKVGFVLREELQLQVSERRRDGFWVYWNEARLKGLSTRFGVNPEELGPQPGKAVQGRLA